MVRTLEIQGDLVQVVDTQIVRQIKLQDLMPHLVKKMPVTMPILPRTAVFAHLDETEANTKKIYLLCEVPASIKTITKENKSNANKRRYKLAMPWTYFWFIARAEGNRDNFTVENYKCFHSRERFTKFPGEFYVAFLPNIYAAQGDICFGSTGAPVGSLADQIDYIVNTFYNTEFNDHLDNSDMCFPFGGTTFKNWVEETASKGAIAYQAFPEWDNGRRKKFTINDLIGGPNVVRATRLEGTAVIPEIPTPMTFGRAEEWWKTLTPVDRGRLKIALGNVVEDDPDAIETPPAIVEVADDGGIPV